MKGLAGGSRYTALPAVLLLWLAGLCAAAQFAKIGVMLPELAQTYRQSGAGPGLLVSSISLVGMLFGLVAGVIGLRLGLRRLLLGGLALGAALSLVQAMLPPLPVLLASRVLEGASHLAIVIGAPTLIATLSDNRWRPAAMALWATFFGVSFALTAWWGLPLVTSHGPGALLLAHGLVTAVVGVALAMLLPDAGPVGDVGDGTASGAGSGDAASADRSVTALLRRHRDAWSSPFVAGPAIGWLFYTLTFVSLLVVLPGLVPAEQRSQIAIAMPLATIGCSMTLGVLLLRTYAAVQVVATGFVLASIAVVALLLFPEHPAVVFGLFAALGLVQGASSASVPELNPRPADQALANGAMAQAGNCGNLIGAPVIVALQASSGVQAMLLFLGACYLTGLAALAFLAARRRAITRPATVS